MLTVDVTPQPTYHALVDEGGYVDAAGTTGGAGYTAYWNPLAGEPYLFNPAAEHPNLTTGPATVPTLIAFSSPRSIGERDEAHQGAAAARSDGVGDQPGLRQPRPDQRPRAGPGVARGYLIAPCVTPAITQRWVNRYTMIAGAMAMR